MLRTSGSPLSATDIAKALSVTRKEHDGFIKRLTAMERDGQIELNRKGRYELAHQPNFIEGRVIGHRDGFGFFVRDDGEPDIFLPEREMQKAMHGDRALVRAVVPNDGLRLRTGLFVSARLILSAKKVTVAVKSSALQTVENRNVVFVRNGDKFETRDVEIGARDSESVEILFGLLEGDRYAARNSFIVKAELGKGSAGHEH